MQVVYLALLRLIMLVLIGDAFELILFNVFLKVVPSVPASDTESDNKANQYSNQKRDHCSAREKIK